MMKAHRMTIRGVAVPTSVFYLCDNSHFPKSLSNLVLDLFTWT